MAGGQHHAVLSSSSALCLRLHSSLLSFPWPFDTLSLNLFFIWDAHDIARRKREEASKSEGRDAIASACAPSRQHVKARSLLPLCPRRELWKKARLKSEREKREKRERERARARARGHAFRSAWPRAPRVRAARRVRRALPRAGRVLGQARQRAQPHLVMRARHRGPA